MPRAKVTAPITRTADGGGMSLSIDVLLDLHGM
jgi:hypothetical protein